MGGKFSGDDIRISGGGESWLGLETGSGVGSCVVKGGGDREEKVDGTRRGSTMRL